MFQVTVANLVVTVSDGDLPPLYNDYVRHARLSDQFALSEPEGRLCFVGVSRGAWPFLVVAQRFSPSSGEGFNPGALVVPETNILFLGAGKRLLAYDLVEPRRLWEDKADMGFLGWRRHGEVVAMSAELELAAWTSSGRKLWTTFVEPPWSCSVSGGRVELDVMGRKSPFDVESGPAEA